jgi:site-specific DNA-methyltransferase (adenine-specific)
MTYQILHGNNLDILPTLADNSIDSIVTDPPYELGFMGKKWDSSGIAYSVKLWQQCLRVLKPGGHLLSFGGTRTYHRVAVAIEDAGFELRDSIAWLYGSGFPKSLDVSKAIDKNEGHWRGKAGETLTDNLAMAAPNYERTPKGEPITPEAQTWQGWGTALKPAFEPVIVARKPIEGTVANNVLKWGTGGLNIDGSRIGTEERTNNFAGRSVALTQERSDAAAGIFAGNGDGSTTVQGRWPANLILDPYTAELLDEQSGTTKAKPEKVGPQGGNGNFGSGGYDTTRIGRWPEDLGGGASRFFYVAKASKRDRNEGLEELLETTAADMVDREPDSAGMNSPRAGAGRTSGAKNFHPTVKPTSLMEYLVKLVTPPNGTVLDPFTGSGSTGKAAILQGFDFIGIEMTEEYLPIIEGRLKHAEAKVAERIKETADQEQEKLF